MTPNTTTYIDDSLLDDIDEAGRQSAPTSALMTIGGSRAVAAVVDEFYRRLIDDPVTSPFFGSADLARLKRHQVLMLVKVLGGPDRYTGRDLRTAHADLRITGDIYARVCLHLLTVMHDFKVPMDVLVAANGILLSVADQVVGEPDSE
jgi:hemoglobin